MARAHVLSAVAFAALLLAAGCTAGGIPASVGGGGGGDSATVDVNLTLHAATRISAGLSGGYAPAVTNVAVGSTIRFHNSDGFSHTATLIAGASQFPAGSPFDAGAQVQAGAKLSDRWSSGTLAAGGTSQTIHVDLPGTYLFGCFFHYGSPMRAAIVAR